MIVWNTDNTPIFGKSFFFGTSHLFCIALPKSRARIPARKKRLPANTICEAVSDASIRNRSYPIFTQGNALPHNRQQIMAKNHTTAVFCIVSFFIFLLFLFLCSLLFFLLSLVFPLISSLFSFVTIPGRLPLKTAGITCISRRFYI